MTRFVSVTLFWLVLIALTVGGVVAEVLYTFESPNPEFQGHFGLHVSGGGDVNNDGYPDVIVGAYNEDTDSTDAGRAYVFSGATGRRLYMLVSPHEEALGWFGFSVSLVGDVDMDGHEDMAVGAPYEDADSVDAGRAYVFSGATGGILYTFSSLDAESSGHFGGAVCGAGDVNDNGYTDVIVGASLRYPDPAVGGGEDRAYVFEGQTGNLLYTLVSPNEAEGGWFGCEVSGAGDVNDDGYDDVIVGAPKENPPPSPTEAGRAYVFSGATGNTLYTLASPNEETLGRFGCVVSGLGDVDGDEYDDVIVGADEEGPPPSPTQAGRAYVFSGATGDTLYTLASPNEENQGIFSYYASGAGDVNNDGHADLAVGAFLEDPDPSSWNAGRAYVFDGQSGDPIFTLVSPNEEINGYFGVSVAHAGDIDGDGRPDVLVGAPLEDGGGEINGGRAYVFSPRLDLWGRVSGGGLELQWSECTGTASYWVYGADNLAYFVPGLSTPYQYRLVVVPPGTTTWSSSNGIGDPTCNWTYLVVAVDSGDQEMARSNRFGEHDFGSSTGP
jgi:hypothetical protein